MCALSVVHQHHPQCCVFKEIRFWLYPGLYEILNSKLSNTFFFQIIAINGVTGPYDIISHPEFESGFVQTEKQTDSGPSSSSSPLAEIVRKSSKSLTFEWKAPFNLKRGAIREYQTFLTDENGITVTNTTSSEMIVLDNLEPLTAYSFQVRTSLEPPGCT